MKEHTMTHQQLKSLSRLASEAAASLIPLAADPRGRDSHGGDLMAQRGRIVARALATLERAGDLARQYRRQAQEEQQTENRFPI
ncbi:MAG: hypothetical protein KIT22_09450 [Verrucomicrobiae bacterium]|nr:hypothetical protein [Verrucomicrobiae bacterium]